MNPINIIYRIEAFKGRRKLSKLLKLMKKAEEAGNMLLEIPEKVPKLLESEEFAEAVNSLKETLKKQHERIVLTEYSIQALRYVKDEESMKGITNLLEILNK